MAGQNRSYRVRLTRADGSRVIMGVTIGGANQEGLTPEALIAYFERTNHWQHHDAQHVEILGPLDLDVQPGIADVAANKIQYHIGPRKTDDDNEVDELDQPVEANPVPASNGASVPLKA